MIECLRLPLDDSFHRFDGDLFFLVHRIDFGEFLLQCFHVANEVDSFAYMEKDRSSFEGRGREGERPWLSPLGLQIHTSPAKERRSPRDEEEEEERTFVNVEEGISIVLLVQFECFGNELVEGKKQVGSLLHGQGDLLVGLQRLPQLQFRGEVIFALDVIDQLFAVLEGIPVHTLVALNPLHLEIVALLRLTLVTHRRQDALDPTRRGTRPSKVQERGEKISQFGVVALPDVAFLRRFAVERVLLFRLAFLRGRRIRGRLLFHDGGRGVLRGLVSHAG